MSRDWMNRNRHRYPENWTEIATAVKAAAGWRCRVCGAPHGPPPAVLTVHQVNHVPADCDGANLLACCQRCHLKCQSLRPRPASQAEAITRLRPLVATRDAQRSLPLTVVVVSPRRPAASPDAEGGSR